MFNESISVLKVRDVLLVTMPSNPSDLMISKLQENILNEMETHYNVKGLIIDISSVDTLDSFFARTLLETSQMVYLMGGKTIIAGMRPNVAITATQLGLKFKHIETALNLEYALEKIDHAER